MGSGRHRRAWHNARVTRSALAIAATCIATAAVGWLVVDRVGWIEIPTPEPADFQSADGYADAGARATQLLAAVRERLGVPGLSAAVSIDGRVVWAAASGWADVERRERLSTETVFRIGSTSKALTGTLLARYVDAGIIDVDMAIAHYMPQLPNPEWAQVTPRQLASHTAGFPEYEENRDLWGLYQTVMLQRHFGDVVDALEVFDELLSVPGTAFAPQPRRC